MLKITRKSRLVKVAAATAAIGSIAAIGFVGNSPANADPRQFDQDNFVGVGSDTSQDVMNAIAGFAAGKNYPAAQTPNGAKQILSFDATNNGAVDTCIETATGAPAMYRPNGSSEGRRALSRAFGGSNYGIAACGIKAVNGLVDFARSSAGPTAVTPEQLVYIPFARDGVSFAYYNVTGSPTVSLTPAQLTSLFSTGPAFIAGKLIVPCGIQLGSGTKNFWDTANGITATEATGTTFCNNLFGVDQANGRLQENKTDELKIKGDLLQNATSTLCNSVPAGPPISCAGGQVISGFSASGYIASGNEVSSNAFVPAVKMGSINLGGGATAVAPVLGTVKPFSPNNNFYIDGTFGRDIFNVLPLSSVNDIGNVPLQQMFVGSGSQICASSATILTFGFQTLGASCGSTTVRGPYLLGPK